MTGSEFDFHYVHLLYYKCRKINPNYGGSYIDSPDWIQNKKKLHSVTIAIKRRIRKEQQKLNLL